MDYKAIAGKFLKGSVSGALVAYGAMIIAGNVSYKGLALSLLSGAIHGGWEAVTQAKA